ncbi:MAG: hypothetical protein AABW51_01115 [Nanoarchaeota archaeon]
MGVLDYVMQMKNSGKNDSEIIRYLQNQGVPPKEIQDALNQAQIKNAVYGDEMQQSIIDYSQSPEAYPSSNQDTYAPQPNNLSQNQATQQIYQPQQQYPQQYQNYQQDNTYYPQETQEYYPQEQEYTSSGTDTSTLIEVAEQVFSDKIKKIERPLDALNEFKVLSETKLKIMEEKLQRIESIIDSLQISILDKIGSYGSNLNSIKKEMEMMQSSFSKMVDPRR